MPTLYRRFVDSFFDRASRETFDDDDDETHITLQKNCIAKAFQLMIEYDDSATLVPNSGLLECLEHEHLTEVINTFIAYHPRDVVKRPFVAMLNDSARVETTVQRGVPIRNTAITLTSINFVNFYK